MRASTGACGEPRVEIGAHLRRPRARLVCDEDVGGDHRPRLAHQPARTLWMIERSATMAADADGDADEEEQQPPPRRAHLADDIGG